MQKFVFWGGFFLSNHTEIAQEILLEASIFQILQPQFLNDKHADSLSTNILKPR